MRTSTPSLLPNSAFVSSCLIPCLEFLQFHNLIAAIELIIYDLGAKFALRGGRLCQDPFFSSVPHPTLSWSLASLLICVLCNSESVPLGKEGCDSGLVPPPLPLSQQASSNAVFSWFSNRALSEIGWHLNEAIFIAIFLQHLGQLMCVGSKEALQMDSSSWTVWWFVCGLMNFILLYFIFCPTDKYWQV